MTVTRTYTQPASEAPALGSPLRQLDDAYEALATSRQAVNVRIVTASDELEVQRESPMSVKRDGDTLWRRVPGRWVLARPGGSRFILSDEEVEALMHHWGYVRRAPGVLSVPGVDCEGERRVPRSAPDVDGHGYPTQELPACPGSQPGPASQPTPDSPFASPARRAHARSAMAAALRSADLVAGGRQGPTSPGLGAEESAAPRADR